VKKFDDMFSRFDKIPACDRRTDGRTDVMPQHSEVEIVDYAGNTRLNTALLHGFTVLGAAVLHISDYFREKCNLCPTLRTRNTRNFFPFFLRKLRNIVSS